MAHEKIRAVAHAAAGLGSMALGLTLSGNPTLSPTPDLFAIDGLFSEARAATGCIDYDSNPAPCANPNLSIAAGPTTFTAEGENVVFSLLITNTSSVGFDLHTVRDNNLAGYSCPTGLISGNGSITCTRTYVTNGADVVAGRAASTVTTISVTGASVSNGVLGEPKGGQPGDNSVAAPNVAYVAPIAPVPTMTEWSLIGLAFALGGGALFIVNRRRLAV
jgi:hypothetical protein